MSLRLPPVAAPEDTKKMMSELGHIQRRLEKLPVETQQWILDSLQKGLDAAKTPTATEAAELAANS